MKIEKVLKELGIEKINSGVSTGTKWQKANGAIISSYSPVDGKLIAKVTCASSPMSSYPEAIELVSHFQHCFQERTFWNFVALCLMLQSKVIMFLILYFLL